MFQPPILATEIFCFSSPFHCVEISFMIATCHLHLGGWQSTISIKEDETLSTYDFICNHLENDYPDAIPVMDEYLMEWLREGENITEGVAGVIYPYLAALRTLTDAGVEGAEKYIVELRTEEVGN